MPPPNIFQRRAPAPAPMAADVPAPVRDEIARARRLQEAGRLDEAAVVYRAVLATWPRQFDCLHYLGTVEHAAGRAQAAIALLEQAVAVDPRSAAAWSNLGAALQADGRAAEALVRLDHALSLNPKAAGAHASRGWALQSLGRSDEALAALDRAIALNPDQPRYAFRRAALLAAVGRITEAGDAFERHAGRQATDARAWTNVASTRMLGGRSDLARDALARAIALAPRDVLARWQHASSWLPLVRDDDEGLEAGRERFVQEIRALASDAATGTLPVDEGALAVGEAQPYFLAYQDADGREALAANGELTCALMAGWRRSRAAGAEATTPAPSPRLRVGIVSAHVREHSVWNALTRGWFDGLDRARFEVGVFHLGTREDEETRRVRASADFFEASPRDLAGWVAALEARNCDLLLYPEIGMDPMTTRLAALRLAPVQAASWGHPQTTGLPTMDAFLSAEALEPADADAHYTERLVRLPGLGCTVRLEVPGTSGKGAGVADAGAPGPELASLLADSAAPLFACPGTPFKYTPRHDAPWIAIARAVPEARFVFFRDPMTGELLDRALARTRRAFEAAGLDPARHLRVLPWLPAASFRALLARTTAFLDTLDFSGFNTVLHAVAAGVPVVTQRGRFLRGRLGSGILDTLGLDVAADDAAYVAQAVRLAAEPRAREQAVARLVAARPRLDDGGASLRALEAWLVGAAAARPARPAPA